MVCAEDASKPRVWEALTVPGSVPEEVRITKYLVPVDPEDPVPTLLLNASAYPLHQPFLVDVFPQEFSDLTPTAYQAMTLYPSGRRFWSGTVSEMLVRGTLHTAVTIWDDPADPSSTIRQLDALTVLDALTARLPARPRLRLHSSAQTEAALRWADVPLLPDADLPAFAAYQTGEAIGRLRWLEVSELDGATLRPTDVLVLDEAPADLAQPVAAVLTARAQPSLSHLSLRLAARNTPNCYARDVLEQVEADLTWVRVRCASDGWSVEEATEAEALAYAEQSRPDAVDLPPARWDIMALTALTPEIRAEAYGAKAAWLARAYADISQDQQLIAGAVPLGWFREHVDSLMEGETIATRALAPERAAQLARFVERTWGAEVAVRLRSSSNAEDHLQFNGAGLYASTWGCAADDLDDDTEGPSHCDPDEAEERTLAAGILEVWASTYSEAAVAERQWYGIDEDSVGMGVLLNDRSPSERANFVALSRVPKDSAETRVLVHGQIGDVPVVRPPPGVLAERVLVGEQEVLRIAPSTILPPGQWVTGDAELLALGQTVRDLAESWDPTMIWDSEWKVLAEGRLVLKQVRPFAPVSGP